MIKGHGQRHTQPVDALGDLPELLKERGLLAVARATDMRLVHLEEIGLHYARTLRAWRRRFMARLDEVRGAGYPDSFIRLWEYYLCYCEGGFLERNIGTVQMLLAKPRNRRLSLGN